MATLFQPVTQLGNDLKNYLNLRLAYVGLQLGNRLSALVSNAITVVVMVFLISMIVLMLSFAFVFWYAANVGTYYHGFLIVSLFYMLVGMFVYSNRRKLFIEPMKKRMHEQLLSELDPDLLPGFEHLKSTNQQMQLLQRRIQQSEMAMQQSAEAMAESLQPLNLIKKLLGSGLTSSALTVSLLEFAISWLRGKSSGKNRDDAGAPSSDS